MKSTILTVLSIIQNIYIKQKTLKSKNSTKKDPP